jgi:hypothetical protein
VVWCEKEGIVIYAPPAKAEAVNAEVAKALAAKAEAVKAEAAQMEAAKKAEAAKAEAAKVEAAKKVEKGGAKKEEKLPKSAFRYESAEQAYYCPQGKRLEPVSRTTEKRKSGLELPVISYRAAGADCQACPQQAGCTSNPKKGRVVKRYEGEEALERLEQRMQEPAAQRIYKLRCRTVELGNADLKEHRGLRSFRGFGRKRARAQAGLIILASNGLKIMNALQRRRTAEHPPASQEKRTA